MYTKVLGATTPVVAATILPNTGSNTVVTIALALGAGMLAWGVMYARVNR